MKTIPKTFEEANARVAAYYDKLLAEGYTKHSAYKIAIDAYKKYVKPYLTPKDGDVLDKCKYCYSPIIFGELYAACGDEVGTKFYHLDCYEEALGVAEAFLAPLLLENDT